MHQQSLLSPETGRRVQVLVPYPLARAYDYLLPEGMKAEPGDYVRVPLGRREVIGVVWDAGADENVDPSKLKQVLKKFDFPRMPAAHRQFVEWVARYTMSDMGAVLKMSLSVPEALAPPKAAQAFTLAFSSLQKPEGAKKPRLSTQRQKVLDLLADGVPRRAADIARETGCNATVIRTMAASGQLRPEQALAPAPGGVPDAGETALALSPVQEEAAAALKAHVREGKYSVSLLDGVTGSGKTEVYFEAVAETLRRGRQVLILLPEISLSAQFVDRFARRFGVAPALWHSEVPLAQRRATWTGAAQGATRVVAGARSALFLPYADLGLIVVDEEHDSSYKQEEGVLYNARDMAIVRGSLGKSPVVLVSATPSLETMVNAREGKYHYLRLPLRHAGAKMPEMHVVDLKKTPPPRQKFIAPPLAAALAETYAAKEQSILFLNRRGYAPLTLCRACGFRFQCPSCSAWLVEHKRLNRMQCHHCGYAQGVPRQCPECAAEDSFAACGPGVERVQEEVQELFPEARTLVLASDIVNGANMLRDAVRRIEAGEVDVIIGTQLVAKGHHFPSLTLVGVIDADLGLSGGDLRAGERTFQLLHQVSGRAGRGEKPGRVFLQTYMPEQQVIRALAATDRDRFLEIEAQERRKAGMPPYGRLAALIVSGPDEMKLDQFCRGLAQGAPRYDDIRILGPAPAPLAFLRGKHRRRFLVKTGKTVAMQKFLFAWIGQVKVPSGLQLKVDIDPQSFF